VHIHHIYIHATCKHHVKKRIDLLEDRGRITESVHVLVPVDKSESQQESSQSSDNHKKGFMIAFTYAISALTVTVNNSALLR